MDEKYTHHGDPDHLLAAQNNERCFEKIARVCRASTRWLHLFVVGSDVICMK